MKPVLDKPVPTYLSPINILSEGVECAIADYDHILMVFLISWSMSITICSVQFYGFVEYTEVLAIVFGFDIKNLHVF